MAHIGEEQQLTWADWKSTNSPETSIAEIEETSRWFAEQTAGKVATQAVTGEGA